MDTVAPESVGMSSERLGRIRPFVERKINEGKFAGVLTLIARHGKVAHFDCMGMMDKEAGKPIQVDTLFRIYSMTKPITSFALMMLYEEGRVRLSDPVSRFIPAFKDLKVYSRPLPAGMELVNLQREITVQDLLTHTSGLSYGFYEDSPVDAMYRKIEILRPGRKSLKEFVDDLTTLPLVHQPGTTWRYSVATDVIGYLVEVISGMPFGKFLEERIFRPLGMVDTGFAVPPEKINRLATVYTPHPESGTLLPIDTPTNSPFTIPDRVQSGGGGLVSTISDYLRFAQMMLNSGELDGARLVSRKTIELITMNHLPAHMLPFGTGNNGYGFGLGVSVVIDLAQYANIGSVGAFEWSGAANTLFWVDPKEKLIGILMTQFMPAWHYPLADDFRVLAYQAIAD